MDMQRLNIRPMKTGEETTVTAIGRKAFRFVESWAVGKPKQAMVAEVDGKILGAIMYKDIDLGREKGRCVYIEEAFVHPEHQGNGVGKKLYAETFAYLKAQGCHSITALVKDDNVASWKPFMDNGFRRVTLAEAIKHMGFGGMLRQYFGTPMMFAVGLDFYLLCSEHGEKVQRKEEKVAQWGTFLLANILLLLPLWIRILWGDRILPLQDMAAWLTILVVFGITRYAGGMLSGVEHVYRMNNCGGFLTAMLSFWGLLFPMNGNWYPVRYENTDVFRKKLAWPELIKWIILLLLSLSGRMPGEYFKALSQMAEAFLVFSVLPVYPFEGYGAGRIFRYKKELWLITAVISVIYIIVI